MNATGEPGSPAGSADGGFASALGAPDVRLKPLLPIHAVLASELQSGAMAAATGDRGWASDAIADLLVLPGSYGFLAVAPDDDPGGFVFCRSVAGEGEILVLAVVPALWRRGLGRLLLETALDKARELGLRRMLLEVAVDNDSARALYESAGFRIVGRRRGYYHRSDGRSADALTLECDLDR